MISIPTVFILGAGSNVDSGFCTSRGLADGIGNNSVAFLEDLINKNTSFFSAGLPTKLLQDAKKLRDLIRSDLHESIDIILGTRFKKLEFMGKWAIVHQILKRETTEQSNSFYPLYLQLFKIMTSSVNDFNDFPKLANNKVTFITFNYDRSLEYFFYKNIRENCIDFPTGFGAEEFRVFRAFFNCYHVYGSFGQIYSSSLEDYLPYSPSLTVDSISDAAERIDVIKNGVSARNMSQILNAVSSAKRIVFIGFSFNPRILDSISFYSLLKSKPEIYCVSKEINDSYFGPFLESVRPYVGSFNRNGLVEPAIKIYKKGTIDFVDNHLPWILE